MCVISNEPDLSWLADAPVFIDSLQIDAFYDAVVGPAFKTVELQISAMETEQQETSTRTSLNAGLSDLFPWLKIGVNAEKSKTKSRNSQEGKNTILQPVESATRRLVELSLHYLVNQQDRICAITQGQEIPSSQRISESPRMIAYIDVPPETIFLPQAAELNDGRVVTFFNPIIEKLQRDGPTLPEAYPETTVTDDGKRQRDKHWKWYADNWNADKVVKAMEEVIGAGGRPRWIDYRMTFSRGEVLHLHVVAHGDYDTGVFAYNLIRRGWRYGLRIVGSLKSQPALNVLAIYEK
jgi:hypothetical protein